MAQLVRIADTQGFNFETITVTSATVAQLTANKIIPQSSGFSAIPARAIITVENNPLRYIYDGITVLTAGGATGHLMNVGDIIILNGIQNMQNFRTLAIGAGTATLQVTYERP